MQLVNVIPISRGVGKETLTYFTTRTLREGVVVYVPLRKKVVPAIVLSIEDADKAKTKIKSSRFAIKKITSRKSAILFLPEFIAAAGDAAKYFAGATGSLLHAATPKTILEDIPQIRAQKKKQDDKVPRQTRKMVLQAEKEDRYVRYKSLIREEFARNASVFLLTPTIQDAEMAEIFLKKGIERYTVLLHSTLTKKEIVARWKMTLLSIHPVLIIATGTFLSIPRDDIETIIVERENSRAYKLPTRPFLDLRVLAEFIAEHKGIRLILSDLPLKVETMWRYRQGELDEFAPLKLRSFRNTKQVIVDMRRDSAPRTKKFEVLSDNLKKLTQKVQESNKNIFIFAARRGLSPQTVCRDCGSAVMCEICSAPVVLHKRARGNEFLCHTCGASRDAREKCRNCSSWRLETLGIGIQYVESELREHFPESLILKIDRDSISTHKQALSVSDKFYTTKGSVLLGTEMALPYLTKKIAYSAVASMDSLFSIPDWRMSEKVLSILLKIKEMTTETVLIQTRRPEQKVLEYILKGNLTDFYRREIKQREELEYPPFAVLIKITAIGTPARVARELQMLKKKLKKYALSIYPPLVQIAKGRYAMHGLLRVKRDKWPEKQIIEILRSLPPYFSIDVDPESLL